MTFDPKIKALIFDCDGTLVNTLPIYYQAWLASFKQSGHEFPYEFLIKRNGVKAEKIMLEFNHVFNATIDIPAFIASTEKMVYDSMDQVEEITPIADILRQYSQTYPCIVFSGGAAKNVHKSLEVTNLKQYAQQIITADDDFPAKDDPEAYKQIAALLSLKPEDCHFFEDGELAIQAARNSGMQVTEINEAMFEKIT